MTESQKFRIQVALILAFACTSVVVFANSADDFMRMRQGWLGIQDWLASAMNWIAETSKIIEGNIR